GAQADRRVGREAAELDVALLAGERREVTGRAEQVVRPLRRLHPVREAPGIERARTQELVLEGEPARLKVAAEIEGRLGVASDALDADRLFGGRVAGGAAFDEARRLRRQLVPVMVLGRQLGAQRGQERLGVRADLARDL